MAYRYIPILRTKSGEADALSQLSNQAQARILPVVNLTSKIPAQFTAKMLANAKGQKIALDGTFNFSATGSVRDFNGLMNALGAGKIHPIPSITFDPHPTYLAAVAAMVNKFEVGLVVQVPLADLAAVKGWVISQSWMPSIVDLIIILGDTAGYDPQSFAKYVSHELNQNAAHCVGWRSIALNAWSAPKHYGLLSAGQSTIPRNEWIIWDQVRRSVEFQLDYSDMGHMHPSLDDVPDYVMAKATVSVRYTIGDKWLNIKGKPISGKNGSPMATQYKNHARTLSGTAGFGVPNCWGDSKISGFATTSAGTGNRGVWTAILLNRHMSVVVDNLP